MGQNSEKQGNIKETGQMSTSEQVALLFQEPKKISKPTRINKLVMSGFKSFAKHTELFFGDTFNCVLGPNGAGKCVDGDSLVYLSDGSNVKIRDLVDSKISNKSEKLADGFMAYDESVNILTLNTDTLKIEPKKVQAFIKRKAPSEMLKITTNSGREIVATHYHPLFSLDGENIMALRADELKEGLRIAVPRKISISPETRHFFELIDAIRTDDSIYVPWNNDYITILDSIKKNTSWEILSRKIGIPSNAIKGLKDKQSINFAYLVKILKYAKLTNLEIITLIPKIKSKHSNISYKMLWHNSSAFSRLLGYLLAEARLSDSNQIWFTNGNEEIVSDYYSIMGELFGIKPTINEYKPNCWDVLAYSSAIQTVLSKFGMPFGRTEHKELTNLFLTHSNNGDLAEFLNGLYCGDGYISKNSIEITTKSRKLAISIQYILTRLGIQFSSKEVVKIATNTGFSGRYKMISVYGTENVKAFGSVVKLVHKEKQNRIEKMLNLNLKINPNIDLIGVNELVKKITKELKLNVKLLRKKYPRLDAYYYNQCTPSRAGLDILIKGLFNPIANNVSTNSLVSLEKLGLITYSDIYWDEITDIDKIRPREAWVYDLCVEKHHNFIANNIIVHNSNVLDAICFVLGKSSSRDLRAEKSANLIYNGGKLKQPAKKGEVSIYFDNSNRTFPTEDKEVKITRIVKQSGQSVYKINDEARTRQQILDLLSLVKINPDGYNIILQGDIERLVEMKPDERRLLIEDIAGISIYEEKKHKATLELQKVEERLKETDIVLVERNSYLKELKKDRDHALKYKEMNDKIKQNKASYLKIQIDNSEEEKKELQKKNGSLKMEFDKITEKISSLKQYNDNIRIQINQKEKEIEEKGEVEQVKLNKEIETLKIELTRESSRIDTLNNELSKIRQRDKDLKANIEETSKKIGELWNSKKEYAELVKLKDEEKKSLNKKLSELKSKNNLGDAAGIEKKVEEIDKNADEIQKEVHTIREKQYTFIRDKDRLLNEIKMIDERINNVIDVEKEYKKQLAEVESIRKGFKEATLELNKCLDNDSSNAAHLSSLRNRMQAANEEMAKLKARDIGIRESARADIAVTKILELKNKKQGIYGTIAELGNASSKYALALEVAAGPRIKSIVVETDKVAAECIKYLKEKKFGIAAFLPLNKIKDKPTSEQIKKLADSKGSYGLAIGLVKFEPKFKKAFNYIFADTIVVDNIDVAIRLGVGNAKFVTLDGDASEISGVMHGGFRAKKRRLMGFKEDELAKEIRAVEETVSKLQSDIDLYEKRRAENESKITELRSLKASLEGEIIKGEKSLSRETSDVRILDSQKKELNGQMEKLDKGLDAVNNSISENNSSLARLKIEKQKLRNAISQLNNPTVIAEIYTYEQKLKELDEDLVRIKTEAANIEYQVKNIFEPEKSKVEHILKQLRKDEKDFTEELKNLKLSIKSRESSLKEKEGQSMKFYSRFKELFAETNQLKEKIQKNDFDIEKKNAESREAEIKLNTLSLKLAEITAAISGLNAEFQQYEGVRLELSKSEGDLKSDIAKFEKMKEQIGSVNMRALEIYEDVEKQYNELVSKKEALAGERGEVIDMMKEIDGKKKELFMQTFNAINDNFKSFFAMLSTKGAQANLALDNEENPFEGGVRINVKITGSKFLDIRGLSGGEKTMTALAFIFAIQEHEPASFYILDEIDAALDRANSFRLAKLIKDYSEKAQYLMISHNDAVVSEADTLYGVSMNKDSISQVVSLRM